MTYYTSRLTLKTAPLYILFTIIIIYTFQGRLFEKPTVLVDHFIAGAGNFSLLIAIPLVVALSVVPLFWEAPAQKKESILFIIALLLPMIIYMSMFLGIERKAAQFDEDTYRNIVVAFENGQMITTDYAYEQLGAPLSQEQIDGRDVWSYTYMPSTGLGWHKRILLFNEEGIMIQYNNMDEA